MAEPSGEAAPPPTVFVVFGATGDLAHRKLYPALASLAANDQLPDRVVVVGVARTQMSDEDFATEVRNSIAKAGEVEPGGRTVLDERGVGFRYIAGSFDDDKTFRELGTVLAACEAEYRTAGNALYYLATIPPMFARVAAGLGQAGLAEEPAGAFRRIVVEKPFGRDLETSRALDAELHQFFHEHQIFRIDHYLAKETVQNILALRFTNTIFEPLWNRRYVDHVQITVAEELGVEHRGTFYEQSGALRDIVQNHLLQVLALTAMEPPASFDANAIRDEKVKALRSIRPLEPQDLTRSVVRGQYTQGEIEGVEIPGYREEEGVSRRSNVETFLALELDIDNWRWAGVPFYLRTGKHLPHRVTEVALQYKQVPFLPLPPSAVTSVEPNTMVLNVQPEEGITLEFAAKVPGATFRVRGVALEFRYSKAFTEHAPEAYERVLRDAFLGDATLFIRSDEVDQAWQVVQPLIDAFDAGRVPLHFYPAGGWGPAEADQLLAPHGDAWRTP
jgi:glucose-6-phosphate 1-dehydrogenase